MRDQPLTPQLVLDQHRLVSEETLEDPADAGRLRPPGKEEVVVDDAYGTVFHGFGDCSRCVNQRLRMKIDRSATHATEPERR